MTQSNSRVPGPGLHVAIIMDGNGRWAIRQGRPRAAGHAAGAEAVRRVVEAAPRLGISTLTLFAFSQDNWRRPPAEVAGLLQLFGYYLRRETDHCVAQGVRLSLIGRRDRLPTPLVGAIEETERATRNGLTLHLRLAIDYSGQDQIRRALARRAPGEEADAGRMLELLGALDHPGTPAREVDLLIRTGGEQRLSDFLLWESAYAELLFVRTMWPEFGASDLAAAVAEFHRRERRFGGLPGPNHSRATA